MSPARVILLAALVVTASTGSAGETNAPSSRPAATVANKAGGGPEGNDAGYLIAPPPAWIEPAAETPGMKVDPASMHYRVLDHQTRIEGGTQEFYSHAVRVVDDTAGLGEASQIQFVFDPTYQTLVVHRIEVVRAGKGNNRLDPKRVQMLHRETQIEQRIYDGRRTFSLVLEDVRVGDEIDIAYSVRGANPVFEGKFVYKDLTGSIRGPIAQYQLRILTPLARIVEFRPGSSSMKVSSRTLGSQLETIVRREAVALFKLEDGAPQSSAIPDQFFASEYAGWGDVARWGLAADRASPGRIAARSDQDARHLFELAAELAGSVPRADLLFDLVDPLVEILEMVQQPLHETSERARQLVGAVLDQLWHAAGDVRDAFRDDQAELGQQPRIWLAWAVRALTKRWRTRCMASAACCSTFFIGGPAYRRQPARGARSC